MKKTYKVKEKNIIKLKSYLEKKPKKNERNTRHTTSRAS